jgi:ABC-type amino acid transport substrate-binding protein
MTIRAVGMPAAGLVHWRYAPAPAPTPTGTREAGTLKVAVYNELAPFSDNGQGIDADLAAALADKLGLKLSLLPFNAGDDLGDDLRNMVWKGHYLGYGPADVMLHVPVDRMLMNANPQVAIFAPYHVETVRLVRSARSIPSFDGLDSPWPASASAWRRCRSPAW